MENFLLISIILLFISCMVLIISIMVNKKQLITIPQSWDIQKVQKQIKSTEKSRRLIKRFLWIMLIPMAINIALSIIFWFNNSKETITFLNASFLTLSSIMLIFVGHTLLECYWGALKKWLDTQ